MSVSIPQLQIRKPQKAKGPAEVAASPSHGSHASEKTIMNKQTDSTPAAGLTNRAPIFALENPAIEMERYASILSHLADDLLSRDRWEKGQLDGDVVLRTRGSTIEDVEFLVGQVYIVARQIGAATTKALNAHIASEGGGAVAGGRAINQLIASLRGGETASEIVQVAVELARKGAAA